MTYINGQRSESCWVGEQEYIPRQKKQQSRKVECVGVWRKQRSLIMGRVERGLEGFISQAQAELQL